MELRNALPSNEDPDIESLTEALINYAFSTVVLTVSDDELEHEVARHTLEESAHTIAQRIVTYGRRNTIQK